MSGLKEAAKLTTEMWFVERSSKKLEDCKAIERILDKVNNFEKLNKESIKDFVKIRENLKGILEERRAKIYNLALFAALHGNEDLEEIKSAFGPMLPEEELTFMKLVKILKQYNIFCKDLERFAMRIRFKQEIPNLIVGTDGFIYGPFERGKVYVLPLKNARAFILRGVAEEVRTR